MKQDHHVGVGSAPKNAFTKHQALATNRQNKDGAIPGGKACKSGEKVAGCK